MRLENDNPVMISPCPANGLILELMISDPEIIGELGKYSDPLERDAYAVTALRIGVAALKHANGALDGRTIRQEGERLLNSIEQLLTTQSSHLMVTVSENLRRYFDPATGELPQRLERLLRKDGDLEGLLSKHLQGDTCTLSETMAKHIGENSPLFKMLSPEQSGGLLSQVQGVIRLALESQRVELTNQFSLDNENSALARMIRQITDVNGQLRNDLSLDFAKIRQEFSIEDQGSLLSRLLSQIKESQQLITGEFSFDNSESAISKLATLLKSANETVEGRLTLDNDNSPLSLLRRELVGIVDRIERENREFHSDVRATLEAASARRSEMARSTAHGQDFENALGLVLRHETEQAGDVYSDTGRTTGLRPYCKVGDHVIELGPEAATPGARIVCESKEDKSYDVPKALAELKIARENRGSQSGIFVFSKAAAPEGIQPFMRYGQDILVVWDKDDPSSDIFIKAAVSVARAFAAQQVTLFSGKGGDFAETDKAVSSITEEISELQEITTWAGTIKSNSQKILTKVETLQANIEKQISILRKHLERLEPSDD
jgi:hypothetical protein